MTGPTTPGLSQRTAFGLLALAYAPYWLNDVPMIAAQASEWVYAIDYGTRLLGLAILFGHPALRAIVLARPAAAPPLHHCLLAILLLILFDQALTYAVTEPLETAPGPEVKWFAWPPIETGWLRWIDLTAGIALVAVSEELVGRKASVALLRPHFRALWPVVAIAAVAFALMHWSSGPAALVYTGLAGVALLIAYLRLGVLWPVIVAHYLIDVIAFW